MYCASCGAQVEDNATFCPACGKSVNAGTRALTTSVDAGGLTDNVAGMLAYITIIPAIVLLVVEPYNRRPFVRFHAFQSVFLGAAGMIIGIAFRILLMIPIFGLLTLFVMPFVWLGMFILAVISLWNAYQGRMWKVPIIGDFAERQAGVIPTSPAAGSPGSRAA
jgi:uncharacterized membrane protein